MISQIEKRVSSKLKLILGVSLLSLGLTSCTLPAHQNSDSSPIDHSSWNILLQKHVDINGMVNYNGFIADSTSLNNYLSTISSNHPNENNWSQDETLAYWINAYNAFTIQLIIRHYPIHSIKDVAGIIPFVNSPWDLKFIEIEGHKYDLNNIEHGIIRSNFDEPRIHFALVCAAISCPILLNEAYTSESLDSQLNKQAHAFFNTPSKNQISQNSIQISKLLKWYEGDFNENGKTIVDYINTYVDMKINPNATVSYLDYNWNLNKQ